MSWDVKAHRFAVYEEQVLWLLSCTQPQTVEGLVCRGFLPWKRFEVIEALERLINKGLARRTERQLGDTEQGFIRARRGQR